MKGFDKFTKSEVKQIKSTGRKMHIADYRKRMVKKEQTVFLRLSMSSDEDMAAAPGQASDSLIYLIPPEEFDYEVATDILR